MGAHVTLPSGPTVHSLYCATEANDTSRRIICLIDHPSKYKVTQDELSRRATCEYQYPENLCFFLPYYPILLKTPQNTSINRVYCSWFCAAFIHTDAPSVKTNYASKFVRTDEPCTMIRQFARVYKQTNYQTNHLFFVQVRPDGSSVSSINRAIEKTAACRSESSLFSNTAFENV